MSIKLATIQTGAAESMTLDPRRIYTFLNDNETDTIYIATGQGNSADGGYGNDKYRLSPGSGVDVGPGETVLNFAASTNSPRLLISSVVAEASVLAACGVS